jgi:hypothetical protein
MCDKRAVTQTLNLLKMYRESLRVALASGRLRPSSTIPDPASKVSDLPTIYDLRKFIDRLAGRKDDQESEENQECGTSGGGSSE